VTLTGICHAIGFLPCQGPAIGEGFVLIPKKNHPPKVIPGWRRIRRCKLCGEIYSRDPDDLLQPYVGFAGTLGER
jgi:hypothetical protein